MLYPEAEVLYAGDGKAYKVDGYNLEDPSNPFIHISNESNSLWVNIRTCQLLLKDLSQISEEEKRELARIAKVEEKHADDCVIGMRSPHRLEHTWIFRQSTIQSIVDAADYLRSKNYMLPYRGIDLYESGVAVKSTYDS